MKKPAVMDQQTSADTSQPPNPPSPSSSGLFPLSYQAEKSVKGRMRLFASIFNFVVVVALFLVILGPIPHQNSRGFATSVSNAELSIVKWSTSYLRNISDNLVTPSNQVSVTIALSWYLSAICFHQVTTSDNPPLVGCLRSSVPALEFSLDSFFDQLDRRLGSNFQRKEAYSFTGESTSSDRVGVLAPFFMIVAALIFILLASISYVIFRWAIPDGPRKHRRHLFHRPQVLVHFVAFILILAAAACLDADSEAAIDTLYQSSSVAYPATSNSLRSVIWSAAIAQLLSVLSWQAQAILCRRLSHPEMYLPPAQPPATHDRLSTQPPTDLSAESDAERAERSVNLVPPGPVHHRLSRLLAPSHVGLARLRHTFMGHDEMPPPYSAHDPLVPSVSRSSSATPSLSAATSDEVFELHVLESAVYSGLSFDADISDEVSDGLVANGGGIGPRGIGRL